MNICVVTVTYGNRFKYLKQVIEVTLKEGACKVIVVDNASEEESKKKLKQLEKEQKDKLKVIYLPENTGSAGGFKRGLEEAYKDKDCEFIWLLDDDNIPQKGALKKLIEFWENYTKNKENLSLLSFREGRELYKRAILNEDPNLILFRNNSFMGFNILDIPKKIIGRLKINKNGKQNFPKKDYGVISVAPYGGLFFHKNLLNIIGYPDKDFYLYADDFDFSYRITQKKGKIILLTYSIIKDLEKSWVNKNFPTLFHKLLFENSDLRVYYGVRNSIVFEKRYKIDNFFLFYLNLFVSLTILKFLSILYKRKDRYKLIKKAIKDGLKNNLGKTL